jgi:hypothetical protein
MLTAFYIHARGRSRSRVCVCFGCPGTMLPHCACTPIFRQYDQRLGAEGGYEPSNKNSLMIFLYYFSCYCSILILS